LSDRIRKSANVRKSQPILKVVLEPEELQGILIRCCKREDEALKQLDIFGNLKYFDCRMTALSPLLDLNSLFLILSPSTNPLGKNTKSRIFKNKLINRFRTYVPFFR